MEGLLLLSGRLAGFAGLLLCVVAGVTRLLGHFYLATFQTATLLQTGIGAIVAGCFCLLLVLVAQGRGSRSLR